MSNIQNKILSFFDNRENSESLINIIMNVCFISTFIGIFFFIYAVSVEKSIVKTQMNIISVNLVNSIKPFLTEQNKKDIQNNLHAPDLSVKDAEIEVNNAKLKKSAIIILSIIFVIMFSIAYMLSKHYKHNFVEILQKNLILLLFIGLTEFTFLNTIPKKFMTGDPNYIKYKILTNLKSKISLLPYGNIPTIFTPSLEKKH